MEHPTIVRNPDGSTAEYFDIALAPGHLERLFRELFEEHWREIIFGPCIQGAVFELRLTEKPKKVTMLDGYLTVDVGPWHFHLCIGEHKQAPTPELARQRQTSRAVFFHEIRESSTFAQSRTGADWRCGSGCGKRTVKNSRWDRDAPNLYPATHKDMTHVPHRPAACCRSSLLPQGRYRASCPRVSRESF